MRIIKSETIIVSRKESDALDLVDKILQEIAQETYDPELLQRVENVQAALSDVYEYIADVEVEE